MGYTGFFLSIIYLLVLSTSCLPSGEKSAVEFSLNDPFTRPTVNSNTPVSFEILKDRILDRKCTSCHSPPKPDLDIDFTSYETTMRDRFVPLLIKGKPEKSRLLKTIIEGEMPPKGPRLTANEIEYIRKWITQCAPEFETDQQDCSDQGGGDDDDWGDDDDFGNDDFSNDDFNNDDF